MNKFTIKSKISALFDNSTPYKFFNFINCRLLSTINHSDSKKVKYAHNLDESTPYRKRQPYRHGYNYKYHKNGPLPRPVGKYENMPLKGLPDYEKKFKDNWSQEKASFGECDYIDILGDGKINPVDFIKGPEYIIGFKGNRLQKLIRRMQFEGPYLKEHKPSLYHSINKDIWYLYKHYNIPRVKRIRDSTEDETGVSRLKARSFYYAFE